MQPYKILFLTADVGHGHLSIHQAIFSKFKEGLKEYLPNIQLLELEITKELAPLKRFLSFGIYKFAVEWCPRLYHHFYRITAEASPETFINQHRKILSDSLQNKLMDLDPDMIVSTHPSGAAFASILKEDGLICPKVLMLTFVTDFATGNTYNADGIIVVPHENLKKTMEETYGRQPGTTEVIPGLLPRAEFLQNFSRSEMRDKIRREILWETGTTYNQHLPIFLAVGGGEGLRLSRLIEFLPKWEPSTPIVVPIITGKNGRLFQRIKKLMKKGLHPNLHVIPLGYKRNIHEYMKAADILISKPGGATSGETLALGLPQIVQDYIEGQEKLNLDFLVPIDVLYHLKDYHELNNIVRILSIGEKIKQAQEIQFPERRTAINQIIPLFWKLYHQYPHRDTLLSNLD